VEYYFTKRIALTANQLWSLIDEQIKTYDYIFVASTDDGDRVDNSTKNDIENSDRIINHCGFTNAHSFPIIDVIPLYTRDRSGKRNI
jgi:hypothetical protein